MTLVDDEASEPCDESMARGWWGTESEPDESPEEEEEEEPEETEERESGSESDDGVSVSLPPSMRLPYSALESWRDTLPSYGAALGSSTETPKTKGSPSSAPGFPPRAEASLELSSSSDLRLARGGGA